MVRVAVAGASGYMGAELLRLLSVHPKITLTGVTSDRLAGEPLSKTYPHLRGLSELRSTTSTPNGSPRSPTSSSWRCPTWSRRRSCRFCGDTAAGRSTCRLTIVCETPNDYVTWYKAPHVDLPGTRRGGVRAAGASPKGHRAGRPGRLAGLLPGRRDPGHGAAPQERARAARGDRHRRQVGGDGAGAQGRKIDPMYLYTEANENVQAYGIAAHRHTPEIEQELGALAGAPVRVTSPPTWCR